MAERQNKSSILTHVIAAAFVPILVLGDIVCWRLCPLKALCAGKAHGGVGCILSTLKILHFFYSKDKRGEKCHRS